MKSLILALICLHVVQGVSKHLQWCEYWTLLDLKESHPECFDFARSKNEILLKIGKSPESAYSGRSATVPKCLVGREFFDCAECEGTCTSPNPTCRRKHCARACICAPGLLRDVSVSGTCVRPENCPLETTTHDEQTQQAIDSLNDIKRYVPVLINDFWRALFGTEAPAEPIMDTNRLLYALFSDNKRAVPNDRE